MSNDSMTHWVPEICYEEAEEGITSQIPFIEVPSDRRMPSVLFIFETRHTGEFEPGLDGDEVPVYDMDLHQYGDMNILRDNLPTHIYDQCRRALGLAPLEEATAAGEKITQKVRENLTPNTG